MYKLLSKNKHPLYNPEDTHDEYLIKLANPQWEFPKYVSKYQFCLFLKID